MSSFEAADDHDLAPNQVLPVANLPRNFDGVPQDGMEYLFTVRCLFLCISSSFFRVPSIVPNMPN